MKEFEHRYINYNKKDIIQKLKDLGAIRVHKQIIYKYIVFTHPLKNQNDYYIRVRKEFDKVTLTYKCNLKEKYVDEYEIEVSDYDQTIQIMHKLGANKKYTIHKLREKWKIEGCKEIVFDTYPGLPEYMEIECDSIKNIKKLEKKLGLVEEKLFHVGTLYEKLYETSKDRKQGDLTFETVTKVIKPYISKNHKLFTKILKIQQKIIKSNKNLNQI